MARKDERRKVIPNLRFGQGRGTMLTNLAKTELTKMIKKYRAEDWKIALDLGCGEKKHFEAGYKTIGIDWSKENSDAEIIAELKKGIPTLDNYVDKIFTSHFLEHIPDLTFMLKEIHRVCKNGAIVHIWVPYKDAYFPDHKISFNDVSFNNYCVKAPDVPHSYDDFPQLFVRKNVRWGIHGQNWHAKLIEAAIKITGGEKGMFRNSYNELYFELEVVK